VGVVQGTNWWNHPKGIRILPKRREVLLATYENLSTRNATSSDATFWAFELGKV
jgi:hypothetical protein